MRTIVVLGSSVALAVRPPRDDRESAPFAALLARRLPHVRVVNASRGSLDIADAVRDFAPLVWAHDPDVVIVQLGINECPPRFLPRSLWRAVYAHPSDALLTGARRRLVMAGRLLDRAARATAARRFNRPWFSPARFERLLDAWLDLAAKELRGAVMLLGIMPPSARVEAALPSTIANARRFNEILAAAAARRPETVTFVVWAEWSSAADLDRVRPDGIHLSAEGHQRLADVVHGHLTKVIG